VVGSTLVVNQEAGPMRNFGAILILLGILGFLYAGSQMDKNGPLPEGLSVEDSLRYPTGRWEIIRYVAAGAAGLGLLLAMFPKGR
jgi:hypothetical protein